MDISRKTDYALRMLAMLAEDRSVCFLFAPPPKRSMSRIRLPVRSSMVLVQAGIVESLRGVHGGMRLKVSPDDVTIRPGR